MMSASATNAPMAGAPTAAATSWLSRLDDGNIIRAAFFIMLCGTAAVLWLDYRELVDADAEAYLPEIHPILPAFDPTSPLTPAGPEVTTSPELLKRPLTITLAAGGTLELTGAIDPGAASRFAAEIAAHGEYIKTVALDSPGGLIADALAMGALIREKGYTTSVAAGALCASSCPLIFAGGVARLATPRSAIGVHQIYATTSAAAASRQLTAGTAMADAQKTTAEISRYLTKMGVDSEAWLRAMETPPDRLYYFSTAELLALKIVTKLPK